jgi:uncharacterized Zn finger protein
MVRSEWLIWPRPEWSVREDLRMAIIEVSEDALRDVAGDEVFGQALAWTAKVAGLQVDGTVIDATVDGVPVRVRVLPDGIDSQCGCPADGLCPHAVATALAWVQAGEEKPVLGLAEVLRAQDRDWLAAKLAAQAVGDPELAARLLAEAEDPEALAEVADLRAEFDADLDDIADELADLDLGDEWWPETDGLDELLAEAGELADDAPDAVRRLADHVIDRIGQLEYEHEDLTEVLERARTLRELLGQRTAGRRGELHDPIPLSKLANG